QPAVPSSSRRDQLVARLRTVFEDVAGVDLEGAEPAAPFIELGLDSLSLTQVALQLQKAFGVKITFRQLMESYPSLLTLAEHLDASLPPEAAPAPAPQPVQAAPAPAAVAAPVAPMISTGVAAMSTQVPQPTIAASGAAPFVRQVIEQQMQLMSQ